MINLTKLFIIEDIAIKQVAFSELAVFHQCLFQNNSLLVNPQEFKFKFHICNFILTFQFSIHEGVEICREDWRGNYRISFGIMTVILQFCVPFVVSLYVYTYIIHSLRDRTKARLAGSVHLQRRKNIKGSLQKKKTAYFRNCSEKGGEGSTQTQT